MSDTYVQNLVDERHKAWHDQKDIITRAADEKRDLTADERATIARQDEFIDGADRDIKAWQERIERARVADESREAIERMVRPAASAVSSDDGPVEDPFLAFLRGGPGNAGGPQGVRAYELDMTPVHRARRVARQMNPGMAGSLIYRDLVEDTAASGGTTVPITFQRSLYDFLEVYSGMRRTGVTIISTASGEQLEFPRVKSHGTAAAVGEGTAMAEVDPSFDRFRLNAYKYGQLVQVSYELLNDSGVDVLGFLANDCARALGRVTDNKYVLGSGASNTPQGVMTAAATGGTSTIGGTGIPGYANLIDMIYSINAEYKQLNPVWLMKDSTVGAIRKLVDTTNRPLWEPSLQVGVPDRLLGYPVVEDPNLDACATGATATASSVKVLAFGAFSAFYIRDVASIRFERSDDFAFDKDLVTFRSVLRTDSELADTAAIKILIGGSA